MNMAHNPACARFSGPLENDRRSLFNIILDIGGWPPSSKSERVNKDLLTLSSRWLVEDKGQKASPELSFIPDASFQRKGGPAGATLDLWNSSQESV